MNQSSKQVAAVTGHDAAIKRIESDAIAAQVEAFLAAGGKVKTVEPVRPINPNMVHGTSHAYRVGRCRCGSRCGKCIKWHNSQRIGGTA